jgi:ABC-type transport system involved in multi-copper enzyme maturation permease subunit
MSPEQVRALPWGVWRRQVAAILRLELKKSFLSKRAWWIYLLAFGPIFICGMHSLLMLRRGQWGHSLGEDSMIFAGIFQVFYLRLGIFFGCVGIFSNLFRGEVLERTLHYYLLSPVRREVLAVAKYLAGLSAAVFFFAGSVALSFVLIGLHFGAAYREYVFNGPGLDQFVWYVIVAVLACIGYGSVFLLAGLIIRNPMIPAAVVMVWENLNPFLPTLLKKFSVIFYLNSLSPVEVPVRGPLAAIAVVSNPTPAWLAIPGLLGVAALVLALAARKARRLEVSYSE